MKIFIFGPCHYLYMRSCGLSSLKQYKTPLGDIEIDVESKTIIKQKTNYFINKQQ